MSPNRCLQIVSDGVPPEVVRFACPSECFSARGNSRRHSPLLNRITSDPDGAGEKNQLIQDSGG